MPTTCTAAFPLQRPPGFGDVIAVAPDPHTWGPALISKVQGVVLHAPALPRRSARRDRLLDAGATAWANKKPVPWDFVVGRRGGESPTREPNEGRAPRATGDGRGPLPSLASVGSAQCVVVALHAPPRHAWIRNPQSRRFASPGLCCINIPHNVAPCCAARREQASPLFQPMPRLLLD
jgi:hypothetical protein